MHRREFLKTSTGALALAALAPGAFAAEEKPEAAAPKRAIKKGIMWGTVGVKGSVLEKMKAIKEAGFEGTEMMSHMDQDEVLRARDASGLAIPSVCGRDHWGKPLSHPDPKVRAEGLEALKQTLRDAKRYGASSVLLVPAVVSKEVPTTTPTRARRRKSARPSRWPRNSASRSPVRTSGTNSCSARSKPPVTWTSSRARPSAGTSTSATSSTTAGPSSGFAFSGPRIQKLHIKEFSRKKRDAEGLWKGFDVPLLEGDNDWPAVMKAVDDIGYHGWAITEQGGGDSPDGLKDLADRLGKILAS
jgi:L-ribulose-5-phosphate 3-epimerase